MSKLMSNEDFIKCCQEILGNGYDYTKVKFINKRSKVEIVCKLHGSFYPLPYDVIYGKSKCRKCSDIIKGKKEKEIHRVLFFKKILENKIDYDFHKFEYGGSYKKSIVICKDHGEFLNVPANILRGKGCRKCGYKKAAEKLRLPEETRIFLMKDYLRGVKRRDLAKKYKISEPLASRIINDELLTIQVLEDHNG